MTIERIVITFNEDGTFKAASAQDAGGLPVPVDSAYLKKSGLGGIAEIEALKAKNTELETYKAKVIERAKALRADALDPEKDTEAATLAATAEVLASDTERQRSELLAKQAEIQAAIAALPQ